MRYLALVMAVMLFAPTAWAVTILNVEEGSAGALGSYVYGQAVTTPSGGPWNRIIFSFLTPKDAPPPWDYPVTVFAPQGTLFLLSEEYLGFPLDLGSSTPGFIASSSQRKAALGWVFDESVTLLPSTRYYFYTNALQRDAINQVLGPGFGGAGPDEGYWTVGPNCDETLDCEFSHLGVSTNYRLSSSQIPEPSALWLLVSGIASLAIRRHCA